MTEQDERLARAEQPARDAMRLHPFYRGKIQTAPKCPVRRLEDFAVGSQRPETRAGTPGPCPGAPAETTAVTG